MTDDDIRLAERLADAAGAAIRPLFRAKFASEIKPDASPVTEADRAAEAAMRAIIAAERPGDGIIGEEYGVEREDARRVWVLDPIDGTRSFTVGRPIFGTLIALIEEDRPVIGVIDQPIARERWLGAGGRTTLNGQPCTTRTADILAGSMLATTSPHLFGEGEVERFLELARACSVSGNLRQGPVYGGDCYNYGLLASGHLDIVVESGLKLYDFAALVPVVEGAGGRMSDWHGRPLGRSSDGHVIAAGNPALIEPIIDILAGR
jgi:inositol-phosphate phosphatase/L-galactose 1-phosphate phosphatase/histidinol-phosphatase